MGDDLGDEWWDNAGRSDVSEAEQEKEEKIQPIERPVKLYKRVKKRRGVTPEEPPNSKKIKTKETSIAVHKKEVGNKSTKPKQSQKKETSIAVDNKEEVGNKSTKPKIRPKKETSVSVEKKEDNGDKSTKPKKRRKKKTITDVLASSDPKPGCPAELQGLIAQYFTDKRSVIELEELKLQDSCFLSSNDLTHTLSSYLKQICPKWAKVHKQHTEKSSVVLLIVCCSALRTIELIKQLPAFKGEAKVLKLFAKHIKVEEQVKLLQKGVTHIGVGTPARLSALIEKDGLNLNALRYLVLDWNWRDQKLRRMADVPEVKVDLLKLLESGVMSACREGKVKIGLF